MRELETIGYDTEEIPLFCYFNNATSPTKQSIRQSSSHYRFDRRQLELKTQPPCSSAPSTVPYTDPRGVTFRISPERPTCIIMGDIGTGLNPSPVRGVAKMFRCPVCDASGRINTTLGFGGSVCNLCQGSCFLNREPTPCPSCDAKVCYATS